MTTMIKQCWCPHEFQDERYGHGQRVHNYGEKKVRGAPGWACTVCGSVKAA